MSIFIIENMFIKAYKTNKIPLETETKKLNNEMNKFFFEERGPYIIKGTFF